MPLKAAAMVHPTIGVWFPTSVERAPGTAPPARIRGSWCAYAGPLRQHIHTKGLVIVPHPPCSQHSVEKVLMVFVVPSDPATLGRLFPRTQKRLVLGLQDLHLPGMAWSFGSGPPTPQLTTSIVGCVGTGHSLRQVLTEARPEKVKGSW